MTYKVEWALTASYWPNYFLFNAKSRLHENAQMRVYIQSVLFEFHLLYFKIRACIFNQSHFNFIVKKKVLLSNKCYHRCYYLKLLFFCFTFFSPKTGSMKRKSSTKCFCCCSYLLIFLFAFLFYTKSDSIHGFNVCVYSVSFIAVL